MFESAESTTPDDRGTLQFQEVLATLQEWIGHEVVASVFDQASMALLASFGGALSPPWPGWQGLPDEGIDLFFAVGHPEGGFSVCQYAFNGATGSRDHIIIALGDATLELFRV